MIEKEYNRMPKQGVSGDIYLCAYITSALLNHIHNSTSGKGAVIKNILNSNFPISPPSGIC